ncbi:GAF domain-containing protein [Actinokineospora sp.]|uniref:GAF domain-containing protein n=1 Tax=Actinokineospora sp. TaxID=1872133 RepID=UPI004037EB40
MRTESGGTVLGTGANEAGGPDEALSGALAADLHALRRNNLFRGLIERAASAELSQDRVRHLLDAVLSVSSDLSLPDMLDRIVAAGCELAGARYGALGVLGAGDDLVEFTHTGMDEALRTAIGVLPAGKGVLGLVAQQTVPLRLDDVTAHAAAAGFPPHHPPMRSFLGVPIRVRGEVYGNLYLGEKVGGRSFTQDDEDAVVALAAAAGMAIDNARLYDKSHRREQWLRATNEVTAILRTGPPEQGALDLLVRRAREIPDAVLAVAAVPDGPEHLVLRAVDGDLADLLVGVRLPVLASLSGDVFSTCRGRLIEDVAAAAFTRSSTTYDQLPDGIKALGPAVIVPLSTGQQPLGVLIVAKNRGPAPFDDDDLRMVASYAGHAALAIEFAHAQQGRQRLVLLEERDRIARDLHDLVIQRLFAIGLGLQGTIRTMEPAGGARLGEFVAEIDQTIREIRRSIFSLQQPANGPYSLRGEILRAISDATASLGYEPTVRLEGPLDSVVPPEVQLDLIATLRESLSNVVRHADAGSVQVTVSVDRRATALGLLVRDDGIGLPTGITQRSGLANMAQRAQRWHGWCHIDSPAAGGTRVDWEVPLARHPRGQEANG